MKNQQAFSLIEVLFALAITLILGAMVVPDMRGLLHSGQDEALRAQILNILDFARSEADIRQQVVSICRSSNQRTCSGEWSDGQLVFIDDAEDGVVHDAEQVILSNHSQINHGMLRVRFYPFYREFIQFHPSVTGRSDNGTFWYCRQGNLLPSWAVAIGKMGNIHVLPGDKSGKIKDASGAVLKC